MENWFTVDRAGLAQLLEKRGRGFAVLELIQNAWDESGTTEVSITIGRLDGSPYCLLEVEDDAPDGFRDLRDAWTLFAPSYKKSDPEKRGRFNVGEKLVLALCRKAEILSTTGGVRFDGDGRHAVRQKRAAGSIFRGELRISDKGLAEISRAIGLLISPEGIETTARIGDDHFSLRDRPPRPLVAAFDASLRTEVADDEGNLRRTSRSTTVDVVEPGEGEKPHLYELGIPVVELDCRWHVNVHQKIPLTIDRTSVLPSFARAIGVEVLNHCHDHLSKDDATEAWVKEAAGDERAEPEAVTTTLDLRFGEHRVSYDPTDIEANVKAAANGYTVVHGGNLSAGEWDNARTAGAITSAGRKFRTARPFGDGPPINEIHPNELRPREQSAYRLALELIHHLAPTANFRVVKSLGSRCRGAWSGGSVYIVRSELARGRQRLVSLTIHECAHSRGGHFDQGFRDALEEFGAKAVELALERPELFDLKGGA